MACSVRPGASFAVSPDYPLPAVAQAGLVSPNLLPMPIAGSPNQPICAIERASFALSEQA